MTTIYGYDSSTLNITYLPDNIHNISGSLTLELDLTNSALARGLMGQYLPATVDYYQNATFIWFTSTPGIIPNAIEVLNVTFYDSDGIWNNLFIGLCEHTVTFPNLPQNDASGDGMQLIDASQPAVYLPPGQSIWEFQSEFSPEITLTAGNPVDICPDGCMWAAASAKQNFS